MTLVQDETVQLGELAGWVNEGAITFVVGEMSFLKKITDEIGAYLHNTPLFPCLATHSVWYDHVRDELLPAGGGHAEEHRAARIQTDHCGGEALVQAHVDILKDISSKVCVRCGSSPVLPSSWWWCRWCWKETRSWSFRRRWIWIGWWEKPSVISRGIEDEPTRLRVRWVSCHHHHYHHCHYHHYDMFTMIDSTRPC